MIKAIRNLLLVTFFAALAAACGGDDGGNLADGGAGGDTPPPGDPPPAPVADVSIEQLDGTWFGTFDSTTFGSLTVTISGGGSVMTIDEVRGTPSDLAGTVTKDAGTPRTFRFEVSPQSGSFQSGGALFVDPAANHLVFLNDSFGVGVLQKGAAPPLQAHSQDDLIGTWAGDAVVVTRTEGTPGFATFRQGASTATCEASGAATLCNITTIDAISRAIQFTLADPRGLWRAENFEQNGAIPAGGNVSQAYISQDKQFMGTFACARDADGVTVSFPGNCDFAAWTRGTGNGAQSGNDESTEGAGNGP